MLHQALCNISKPLVKSNWSYRLEMPNWGQNQVFFPVWSWNLTDDLRNNRAPILCYPKFCASFQSHQWIKTEVAVRKRSIWVKIGDFFVPYDLEIWCMLLCCLKLCASFHSHRWIQTGVTVWKYSIWAKIGNFCSLVTLIFENNDNGLVMSFFSFYFQNSHLPNLVSNRRTSCFLRKCTAAVRFASDLGSRQLTPKPSNQM